MGSRFTMGLMGKSKRALGYLRGLAGLCKTFYGILDGF